MPSTRARRRAQAKASATAATPPSGPSDGLRAHLDDAILWTFVAAVVVLAFSWFFGLTTRLAITNVDIVSIRNSGIRSEITDKTSAFAGIMALFVLITAMYILAMWATRRGFYRSWAFAIGGCVLAMIAVVPQMPVASPDAVHLAADVRTFWVHHTYPATKDGVPNRQDDPVARQVLAYSDQQSTYGPVAYVIGGLPLPITQESLRYGVLGQKIVSALALLATAILTGMVAKRIGKNPAFVTAAVGLNPLFLLEFAGDGHNDSIMTAFAVASLLFIGERAWRSRAIGGGFAVLSALSKFSLVIASPIVLASWVQRYRLYLAIATFAAALIVLIVMAGQTGSSPLVGITENTPYTVLLQAINTTRDDRRMMVAGAYAAIALVTALIMWRHPLNSTSDLISALGLQLALFLFLFSPTLRHWYQLWAFPFIILSTRRWLVAAAMTFSCGALLPIMVRNWVFDIQDDWNIHDPKEWSVVLLWVMTIVVGGTVWWMEQTKKHPSARQSARAERRREELEAQQRGKNGRRRQARQQSALAGGITPPAR